MIENITVNDRQGNGIFAEGIAYIQFLSSGTKYILYTMNEPAPNDTKKMYVGELTDTVGSLGKISDEAWANTKEVLNKISCGEVVPDVKFLNMSNATFNIGIPKKLAITTEVKQAFKDQQRKGVLASQQQQMGDVPVMENTVNGAFYNQEEVNGTPAFAPTTEESQEQVNIFDNPIKPEFVPISSNNGGINQVSTQNFETQGSTQAVEGTMPQNQAVVNGQIPQGEFVSQNPQANQQEMNSDERQASNNSNSQNNMQNPYSVTPQAPQGQTGSSDNPFIYNQMPLNDGTANDVASALETASLIDTGESIQFQEGLATNLSNDLGVATGINPVDKEKEVTKEEALEALDTLNRYFKNTKELPSELANELNGKSLENKEIINQNQNTIADPKANNEMIDMNSTSQPEQPEMLYSNNFSESTENGFGQEQVKTLSLVPDNMPSVTPAPSENNGYFAENGGLQEIDNQDLEVENQMLQGEMATSIPQPPLMQTGYVANSNGPAVDMSSTPTNINAAPVVLPDNYNPQAMAGNTIMGPGSLPTENMTKAA